MECPLTVLDNVITIVVASDIKMLSTKLSDKFSKGNFSHGRTNHHQGIFGHISHLLNVFLLRGVEMQIF